MPPNGVGQGQAPLAGDFPPDLSTLPAFNLVVNPFEPIIVPAGGQQTRYRYSGSGPLKPQDCKEHLTLYLKIYDWKDKAKLDGLSDGGRLTVFHRPPDDRAMVTLISGFRGSGRTSALNLLKYEFSARSAVEPLVLEYSAKITTDLTQHAKEFALILQRAARRAGHPQLANQLATTQQEWVGVGGSSPETLFDFFKQDISDLVPGLPVAIVLDAQDHKVTSDVWRPICRMLSRMSNFIIVSLSDWEQAKHFRANLERGEFDVAWVDAPKVTETKITQFLSHRLSKERAAPEAVPSLAPFTPEALQVLFRPTGNKGPLDKEPPGVTMLPIAVAMSRLAGVFQRKAAALMQELGNGGALTPAKVLITGQDMEDYLGSL
jgi:hypothetical protein